ncbi:MAG: lysine-2,3-aminomutase-like protein [Bauldia sp.]|nr:lysine-2,3-aminomutase-like protein [Bauldia sp.]
MGVTLRSIADLAAAGLAADDPALRAVAARYAVAVTPEMAALIDAGDPADPIARQFLPDPRELTTRPEERADPIGDRAHTPVKGIVHRYPDRVLLKPVHVCPVYCRFCFRREMVGPDGDGALTPAELAAALDYVRAHPGIFEVILTGGDPLMLAPKRAAEIAAALGGIAHLGVVRWHSRVPIVDPGRVTPALVDAVVASGKPTWLAVHVNHPRELTDAARGALKRLADGGVILVSQTVLLKGVNDDADVLAALMRALVTTGVRPYYLHHADLAPGTAHFRTTIAEGQAIMRALRGRLSGIALPTYVLDVPDGFGKVPAGPSYVADDVVTDVRGDWHAYPPRGSGDG